MYGDAMEGSKNLMIVKTCQSTQPLLDLQFQLDDRCAQAGGLSEASGIPVTPLTREIVFLVKTDGHFDNTWHPELFVCRSPRKFMLNLFGELLLAPVEVGQCKFCWIPWQVHLEEGSS